MGTYSDLWGTSLLFCDMWHIQDSVAFLYINDVILKMTRQAK